jgi:hypothetical protein
MARMSSESWASYRAAMPPECFGEPNDGPDAGPGSTSPSWPTDPSMWWAVEWYAPLRYWDAESGVWTEMQVPTSRYFAQDRHAKPEQAARRWAEAMARRARTVFLYEGWDDAETEEIAVWHDGQMVRPKATTAKPEF